MVAVQEQFFKLNWSEKWASVVHESVGNQISFVPNETHVWDLLPYPSEFFSLLPESKRTDMYSDIITKFSWMDRLPNYLNNGALFVHALQVRVELHYKLSPQKVVMVDYTRSGHLWDVQFKGFHCENFVVWRQWSLLYIWTSVLLSSPAQTDVYIHFIKKVQHCTVLTAVLGVTHICHLCCHTFHHCSFLVLKLFCC